jgi:outer membrane lipoprotein SlyB
MFFWHPRAIWLSVFSKEKIEIEFKNKIPHSYVITDFFSVDQKDWYEKYAKFQNNSISENNNNTQTGNGLEFRIIEDSKYNKFGIPAAESLGLYGYGVYHDIQVLDFHVYDMMGRFSHEQITSTADLANAFKEHLSAYDWWNGVSAGAINKYKGHLAEEYIAEHFEEAGANVNWPDATNQPGYDYIINGHEINAKLMNDASSLANHFDKYPDISVVVPHDMNNIPNDAVHFNPVTGEGADNFDELFSHKIIVDDALSNADIAEHTEVASNLALGTRHATHAFHGHVPFITLALSGTREFKLLSQSKTDVATAIKNISLDVAGRGVGAFAGAKAGALSGAIFGPHGAAIGALFGVISGAIAGLKVSESIKTIDFESAIEKYNKSKDSLEKQSNNLQNIANKNYVSMRSQLQTEVNELAEKEIKKIDPIIDKLQVLSSNSLSVEESEKLLRAGLYDLEMVLEKTITEKDKQSFYRRFIWMNYETIAFVYSIKYLESLVDSLKIKILELRNKDKISRDEIFSVLAYAGIAINEVKTFIESTEKERRDAENLYEQTMVEISETIMQKSKEALDTINEYIEKTKEEMQRYLLPPIREVNLLAEKVKSEAAKLGR